jgi:predicted N-acetyltransferase YhbS
MPKSKLFHVRAATLDDVPAVSRVILEALRRSNAKDYSPEVISRVETSFSPSALLNLFQQREVFVAVHDQRIVGTASLDRRAVRTMFVTPEIQRQGVGRRLMEAVEGAARKAGIDVLAVPSSVTAEQFYAKLGYEAVRDSFYGDERTIIMERVLKTTKLV